MSVETRRGQTLFREIQISLSKISHFNYSTRGQAGKSRGNPKQHKNSYKKN
jgi:hypothetical protein